MRRLFALFIILGVWSCTPPSNGTHQVTKVVDGDTLVLLTPEKQELRIDIPFIDAPEREQPMGRDARKHLEALVLNKYVAIVESGELLLDQKSIGLMLVEQGFAWANAKGATFETEYAYTEAQNEATDKLVGIWSLAHELRISPWQWREDATKPVGQNAIMMKYMQRQRDQKRLMDRQQQMAEQAKKMQEYSKQQALKNKQKEQDQNKEQP